MKASEKNINTSRVCQNFFPREAFFCVIRVRGSLITTKKFGLLREEKNARRIFFIDQKNSNFLFLFCRLFFHVFLDTRQTTDICRKKCEILFFISFITSKTIFDEKTKKKKERLKNSKKEMFSWHFHLLVPETSIYKCEHFRQF